VKATPVIEADLEVVDELLPGKEEVVYCDATYLGADRRVRRKGRTWRIALKRGMVDVIKDTQEREAAARKGAGTCVVGASVRVIKRQFGHVKVGFYGVMKNTAQIVTPFAMSNL
jgi:transposase, IS5 family